MPVAQRCLQRDRLRERRTKIMQQATTVTTALERKLEALFTRLKLPLSRELKFELIAFIDADRKEQQARILSETVHGYATYSGPLPVEKRK